MHAQILGSVLWLPPDVKFTGQGTEDVRQADIETEYCANVYFNQNQGYSINSAVVYDGLTAHIGVAKAWWKSKIEQDEVWPDRLTLEELEGLDATLGDDVIEISAAGPAAEDGLYEVTITTEQDLGQVRIEPLPPEEFLISKKAKSLKSAPWWVTGPVGASRSCSTRATPWSRSRRSARRTGPRTARSSSTLRTSTVA